MGGVNVEYTQNGEKKHEHLQLTAQTSTHQLQAIIAERLRWDVNSFRIILNGSTLTEATLRANVLANYTTVNVVRGLDPNLRKVILVKNKKGQLTHSTEILSTFRNNRKAVAFCKQKHFVSKNIRFNLTS